VRLDVGHAGRLGQRARPAPPANAPGERINEKDERDIAPGTAPAHVSNPVLPPKLHPTITYGDDPKCPLRVAVERAQLFDAPGGTQPASTAGRRRLMDVHLMQST